VITSERPVADVQSRPDRRRIPIDQVGVSDLRYLVVVADRSERPQPTVARLRMSVSLPQEVKGTHMSRFIEVLNRHREGVAMATLPLILAELRRRLGAASARIEVAFPYFRERRAPVSGASGLVDYDCVFAGAVDEAGIDCSLAVRVPDTSLCPCSKEISDYGAHNQRGFVRIEVRAGPDEVGIDELIEVAERSASSPIYSLLKRADERAVTMRAYDNPVFVEDVVRNVATELQADRRIAWFRVEAENDESIHNHVAFARVEWARPADGA
jgi:GTP cyclohydrolase I